MPAARLTMRTTREILRLRLDLGRTHREIADACRKSPSTVGDCLTRFRMTGLPWPLPEELDDEQLEEKLYPKVVDPEAERPLPDWELVHRELRRKHVTLQLLWAEYVAAHPNDRPFNYSWFCHTYRKWTDRVDLVMRQEHKLGEKTFVDWAGTKVPVVDSRTGEVQEVSLFVAVLGGSNYTYAEAFWNQKLPAWISAHVRMFDFFGGCTEVVVPDNAKTGVTKADYFEPDLNPTYDDWAEQYKVAVIPTRALRPKDKAKVESGVRIACEWILARLRNVTFYSLDELNNAIYELLVALNEKPFQKLPGSRKQVFEEQERATLKALPTERYEFAEWKKARVFLDYHVEVDGHYYSVPFTLVREHVEVRLSATTVEVLHAKRRVASHRRSHQRGGHTTCPEHMPPHHRQKAEWTPERVRTWATRSGPAVQQMVDEMMERRDHPEQAVRSCFGLLRLGLKYGDDRLNSACRRALRVGAYRYKSVKSILDKGLDQQVLPGDRAPSRSAGHHENVRGAAYYAAATAVEGAQQLELPLGDHQDREMQ